MAKHNTNRRHATRCAICNGLVPSDAAACGSVYCCPECEAAGQEAEAEQAEAEADYARLPKYRPFRNSDGILCYR